eukprot:TRINITY_DN4779_c0_g2_i1.p1 TRINITY_DN4779_c0_g2~~TRINITY_DN4779_c0_g2_i1.p1  ORF type:complete len:221 (+),score=86.92 TRINITY_DN4779_c0_g2_i1:27-665(+)
MGFLFSKNKNGSKENKNNKVTQQDQVILDMKNAQNNLKRIKKKCETTIAREVEIAKELKKKGDKKGALLALKKKKLQETQLEKVENQIFNLDQMIQTVDWKVQELQVIEAMKQGKNALEELNDMMKIEDVEQLMLENEEALQKARELEELLTGKFNEEEDEEIENELNKLIEEEDLENTQDLPNVPQHDVPKVEKTTTQTKQTNKKVALVSN